MISFQGVTKCYGAVTAVDNLDLQVSSGELFGFLGPNGAGKTTTIKMGVGIMRPTRGRITVAGCDVIADGDRARAQLGYVPDQPYLYDKLTGREFLSFVADLYDVPVAAARRRAEDLMAMFQLGDVGDSLIEGYSHGMRQKLVLASVFVHEPRVLFLDEPTTALDPHSARLVKEILREMCHRGATVFMSTHVLEIAERMCDRVAIIHRGRIVATGTAKELAHGGEDSLESAFLSLTGASEDARWRDLFDEETLP